LERPGLRPLLLQAFSCDRSRTYTKVGLEIWNFGEVGELFAIGGHGAVENQARQGDCRGYSELEI
jgi:hypothetical protein